MSLLQLSTMLALGAPAQPGQQAPPFWTNLVPLVLLVVVFYFALIRPQQRKQREQTNMLKTVRRGDKVTTSSGILGTVLDVNDKTVTIRSKDTKLEVTKTAISEISERSGESSES
jgi:preprotein translocase subunit YajC